MAAKKPSHNFPGTTTPDADPAHMGDMMTAILRAQAKMTDAVLSQNIEALGFLKSRYEQDRKMLATLAAAEDPRAAMSVLSGFWSRASSDYADEVGKLSALAAATTEQVIEGVTEEVTAVAGGAPRRKSA